MKFFDNVGDPYSTFQRLVQLSVSRFVQKIKLLSLEVVEKQNKCIKFLAPVFYSKLLVRFTVHRLAKFG